MGSRTDLPTMRAAADVLESFGVANELRIVSAHRTPRAMFDYATQAEDRGIEVIIAGAGGAAHLPGMLASLCVLPVIGVPVPVGALQGADALLSIVQMPTGCPVATVAIGQASNAGHLAVRILGQCDPELRTRVRLSKHERRDSVLSHDASLRDAPLSDP